jgi:ABC-type nickel/cobalt efflux system permease component RcnA
LASETAILAGTAATLGFVHTILGPDHYLPFVMMSWARKWSAGKTALITFLSGLGHVGSSVVLGLIGFAVGTAVKKLEWVESIRGDMAAWLLIGFGLAYLMWAIRRLYRGKPHVHRHAHAAFAGSEHVHDHEHAADDDHGHEHAGDADHPHAHKHTHLGEHAHVHDAAGGASIAPWTLFVIFVLGPCEPLIPVLMYPAAKANGYKSLALIALVFSAVTIATMLAAVMVARKGVSFLPMAKLQKYAHVMAGAMILLCGVAIVFGL